MAHDVRNTSPVGIRYAPFPDHGEKSRFGIYKISDMHRLDPYTDPRSLRISIFVRSIRLGLHDLLNSLHHIKNPQV
jgi:hypothetical protein